MQKLQPKLTTRINTKGVFNGPLEATPDTSLDAEIEEAFINQEKEAKEDGIISPDYSSSEEENIDKEKVIDSHGDSISNETNMLNNIGKLGLSRAKNLIKRKSLQKENESPRSTNGYDYKKVDIALKSHDDYVRNVTWLYKSSEIFCSGAIDGTVTIHNRSAENKELYSFKAHNGGLMDINWSSNMKFFLTCSVLDKEVKIWEFTSKKCVVTLTTNSGVTAAIFSPSSSKQIVVGTLDGDLYYYDIAYYEDKKYEINRGYNFSELFDTQTAITALAFGTNIKVNGMKEVLFFAGTAAGRFEVHKFRGHLGEFEFKKSIKQKYSITHIVHCQKHKSVLINSADDKIKMLSIPDLQLTRVFFHPHRTASIRCAICPRAKILVTGSEDGKIRIFDLHSGLLLNTVQEKDNKKPISCVDISADGTIIASSVDGTLSIWELMDSEST